MLSTKLKEAAGNSADATLYVDDVFSTYLYTGNASTQTITNGIDLAGKGGMVWIKDRTSANPHQLIDTSRGGSSSLASNSNTTPTTGTYITSFNSNGFSLSNYAYINAYGYNFASWTFRKAAKFFDVVTYTGTGSARTIAHSLGVAPGMVIVKRTDAAGNWQVYSNGLTSAANSIQLNLTAAQASAPTVWNSTAPTSSVFSVGTDATVNASGGIYVAYLYAHDTSSTGIIQCGSFTSTGTAVGADINVNLGWETQYVLVKPNNATNWQVYDTMRGFPVTDTRVLYPNLSDAEVDAGSAYSIEPTATGFTAKRGLGWAAGTQVLYMAIRRPNKPPTSGTQVFSPYTRSGNNTVTTVTGVGFSPDMVMGNSRESGYYPGWTYDRLRGTNAGYILTPSTGAETYDPSTTITISGVQDAYILPTSNPNRSAATAGYVDYRFKRAPGFFDEVCYTGTGANTTQAHNLTVAPELMIVKKRSAAAEWSVYGASLGVNGLLILNSAGAVGNDGGAFWNNTSPTSSVFSLGTDGYVNGSGATYVTYLFATLAGISKVGSYTGNGTGQAIACGFSAGARFVLIKRVNGSGNWYTFDSARGLTSGSSPYLLLNSTAAEVTGNNGVYASTGGFTLGATAITTTNILGASYIYLSVA